MMKDAVELATDGSELERLEVVLELATEAQRKAIAAFDAASEAKRACVESLSLISLLVGAARKRAA